MAASDDRSSDATISTSTIPTLSIGRSALTRSPLGNSPPVFIADSDDGLIINLESKPGGSLAFKPSYYSNAIFASKSRKLLIDWLRSIPLSKRYDLTQVRYDFQQEGEGSCEWNESAMLELADLWDDLVGERIFAMPTEMIYIRVWDMEHKCWGWWNGSPYQDEPYSENDDEEDDWDENKAETTTESEDESDRERVEVER